MKWPQFVFGLLGTPKFFQIRWDDGLWLTISTEPDITIWWSYWLLVLAAGDRNRPFQFWEKRNDSPREKHAKSSPHHKFVGFGSTCKECERLKTVAHVMES